jgi:hypothetical protein
VGDAFEQAEGEFGVEDCIMSSSTEFNNAPNGVQPSPQSTDKFDRLKDRLICSPFVVHFQ